MIKRIESGISAREVDFRELSRIKNYADKFGLTGVVLLKKDGSIKVIAEGEEENLAGFVKKLEEEEHTFSMVENFYEKMGEATGEFEDFSVNDQHLSIK